jgi:hypothetical protein
MTESEGRFSKPRLEAFSDGVIAVIAAKALLIRRGPEQASGRSRTRGSASRPLVSDRDVRADARLRPDILRIERGLLGRRGGGLVGH